MKNFHCKSQYAEIIAVYKIIYFHAKFLNRVNYIVRKKTIKTRSVAFPIFSLNTNLVPKLFHHVTILRN